MSNIKYRGILTEHPITYNFIRKMYSEGFNIVAISSADVFNYQLAESDDELAKSNCLSDMYNLYLYAKTIGYKKIFVDVSDGRFPFDTNDFGLNIINLFSTCDDVIFYQDEPQLLMKDIKWKNIIIPKLTADEASDVIKTKFERAKQYGLPLYTSITEKTENTELHNLLCDKIGIENIVFSSYYISCFKFHNKMPFTWHMGQLSTANLPTTGTFLLVFISLLIILFGISPYWLLLIIAFGLFPLIPLQMICNNSKDIDTVMLYQGNKVSWSFDEWEQKILSLLGFNSLILNKLTNYIIRKIFILFFRIQL